MKSGKQTPHWAKAVWILGFTVVFVFAIALRGLELYTNNYLFLYDQGLYYQDVVAMIEKGVPSLVSAYTPIPGVFQGPYFYYILAVFYWIFFGNPIGGMVFMFCSGLLTVAFGAYIAYRLFNRMTGLITAFLFAVSPALASASRMLWPPYVIHALMVVYIYMFIQVLWGKVKYFPWVLFTVSLIVSFEIPAGIVLYAPTVLLSYIFNRKIFQRKMIGWAIAATVFPLLPQIVFNFRHNNIMLQGVLGVIRGTYSAGTQPMSLAGRAYDHFVSFWLNLHGTLPIPQTWWPLFIVIIILLLVWLLKRKAPHKEKVFIISLTVFPLIVYIELLLSPYIVWSWYLIPLHPMYILLFGYIFTQLVQAKGVMYRWIAVASIILIVWQAALQLRFMYTQELHDTGGTAKIAGKLEAIDYIFADAKGEHFNVLVFTPPVYTYAYDYLLSWYAKSVYGTVPGNKKEGLLYLWIEPEPGKPWTYNGWLTTVIQDGIILSTVELPSGFIIQKRIMEN